MQLTAVAASQQPTTKVGAVQNNAHEAEHDPFVRMQFEHKELGQIIRAIKLLDSWGFLTKQERDTMCNRFNFYVQR
jgi:hypothetical protein